MMPWNDLRKGDCCGRLEAVTDGYYCKRCDFFVHKNCGESPEYIEHPSHSGRSLRLHFQPRGENRVCYLCGRLIVNLTYRCEICYFNIDLYCAKYPPPDVVDVSKTHHHKLTHLKERFEFECDAKCGINGYGYPYECLECDLTFHLDCIWKPSEVKHTLELNHSYHSLHPLKLLKGRPPNYSDGKCRLCGRKVNADKLFYHCSSCNFTLDMHCVLNPPPKSLLDLRSHDHQLTLLPRLGSFTCNACGLSGDRSPYICVQCDFIIHQQCLGLPHVININRHDHRISLTYVLGVVDSVCGVCHKKVDWTWGGYSCHKCHAYVVHSKCATRNDVWNGIELEGVPEEAEDIEPYVIIDHNTIQHFSHKEHHLRLNINGLPCEEKKRCNACSHPVSLQPFYGCMDCGFTLHQKCAEFPKKKWHVLHNERLALVTSQANSFQCDACFTMSNGFVYQHGDKKLDVRCSSISEPVFHASHPHHPLYYISPEERGLCSGCKMWGLHVLRCIEDDCGFLLDFRCATLPQVVNHRVHDHPLSLCYGEEASGDYWCDICETRTDPNKWFYTCKDHQASLHTKCVLGDFGGLMPGRTIEVFERSYEVLLNDYICRPFCRRCKSRCMSPIILKMLGTLDTYICSVSCMRLFPRS